MNHLHKPTLEQVLWANNPSLDRRRLLVALGAMGATYCGGQSPTGILAPDEPTQPPTTPPAPNPPPPEPGPDEPNPPPQPPDPRAVELKKPISGFYKGESAGNGNFPITGVFDPNRNSFITIPTINIPIVNGNIEVTKDKGLVPGTYIVGPITTTIGEDRYAIVDVFPTEMSINLGGRRLEQRINVIEKGSVPPRFAQYALRNQLGRTERIVAPLKIGLLDTEVYSADGAGNLIPQGYYTMPEPIRTAIYEGLNTASFWSGGLYPQGDLPKGSLGGLFHMASKGDQIPRNRRSNGWLIIYPYANVPKDDSIQQSDSAGNGFGPAIIWASMGFRPEGPIHKINVVRDTRESFGWVQVRDGAEETEAMRRIALLLFARPPDYEMPDRALTLVYTPPNLGQQRQQSYGILDFFRGLSFTR